MVLPMKENELDEQKIPRAAKEIMIMSKRKMDRGKQKRDKISGQKLYLQYDRQFKHLMHWVWDENKNKARNLKSAYTYAA